MKYYYGMRLRGFSIGCQPMEGLIDKLTPSGDDYYDILVYNRALPDEDVKHYSLTALSLNDGVFTPIVSIRDYIKKNRGPYEINGIKFGLFYVDKHEEADINFKSERGFSFKELLPMVLEEIRNTLDTWAGTIEELKQFFEMYADCDGVYRNKHFYIPIKEIKRNYIPFGVIMD